jgi:hypothetical protein
MSATESTISKHYRLEIRLGRMGWRAHARGPNGIEWTSAVPWPTRDEALEEGRAALRETGLDTWDEWMDGVTDNHFDPRMNRKLVIDVVEEAKRAGLEPPDPEKQAEATRKLRELEAKRQAATDAARQKVVQAPPDSGMGVDTESEKAQPASPLKAQRAKIAKAKEVDAG